MKVTCTSHPAEPRIDILKIFAEDRDMILYRRNWRQFTGSVTATILLQQIFFRWNNGNKPFYKFKEPCSHKLYKQGDSWSEELGFSRREFDNAIKKIGFKRSRKNSTEHSFPVEYWVTPSRETYYTIHVENFCKCLWELYRKSDKKPDEENNAGGSAVKSESGFTEKNVKSESEDTKSNFGDLVVKSQSAFTKSENAPLPPLYTETTADKKTTTTTTPPPPVVVAVTDKKSDETQDNTLKELCSLIPQDVRRPGTEALIKKHLAGAYCPQKNFEYIRDQIAYTNHTSDYRKHNGHNHWTRYKAYLGKSLDYGYGAGFCADAEAEKRASAEYRIRADKEASAALAKIEEDRRKTEQKIKEEEERNKLLQAAFDAMPKERQTDIVNQFAGTLNSLLRKFFDEHGLDKPLVKMRFFDFIDKSDIGRMIPSGVGIPAA